MCRMLALRSARPATLDRMLLEAPRGLRALSREHRHGWGLAQYVGDRPQVVRGTRAAWEDPEFERAARTVEGDCLLAHIRKASVGSVRLENSHPFAYGRWLFAHNGTVRDFDAVRPALEALALPEFRALLRGDTDSERCFTLFLTRLAALGALDRPPVEVIASALAQTIAGVRALSPDPATALTFLATDGRCLVGVRSGDRELAYMERIGEGLLLSSEPMDDDEDWHALGDGEVLAVGADLALRRWRLAGAGLVQR